MKFFTLLFIFFVIFTSKAYAEDASTAGFFYKACQANIKLKKKEDILSHDEEMLAITCSTSVYNFISGFVTAQKEQGLSDCVGFNYRAITNTTRIIEEYLKFIEDNPSLSNENAMKVLLKSMKKNYQCMR